MVKLMSFAHDRLFMQLSVWKKRSVVDTGGFILMLINQIMYNGSQRRLVVVHLLLS